MNKGTMKAARFIIGIALLAAQVSFAQLKVGDNTQLKAGGLATFGYAGDYGNNFPSSHGLDFGLNGELNGFYYNPNFLSFSATPYINQSRNDSSFQSLTGASGINGTANFFTGSNYPGTISYRYDTNSTGTFGLLGQPDFTTHGRGQGFPSDGARWCRICRRFQWGTRRAVAAERSSERMRRPVLITEPLIFIPPTRLKDSG
jgi:hypothetical protein